MSASAMSLRPVPTRVPEVELLELHEHNEKMRLEEEPSQHIVCGETLNAAPINFFKKAVGVDLKDMRVADDLKGRKTSPVAATAKKLPAGDAKAAGEAPPAATGGFVPQSAINCTAVVAPIHEPSDKEKEGGRVLPRKTMWCGEEDGTITVRDAISGSMLYTIVDAKAKCRPTCMVHVPCTKQLFDASEVPIERDFVWVGFNDGSVRLFPAKQTNLWKQTNGKSEADYFRIFELPKHHCSIITSVALSPHHYTNRSVAHRDEGSAAKAEELQETTDEEMQHMLCVASADSTISVWNIEKVYQHIHAKCEQQRKLDAVLTAATSGGKVAAKQGATVAGCQRGAKTYFKSYRFGVEAADDTMSATYCMTLGARPVARLKGAVCGIRSLSWVSTLVTTEGYKPPRDPTLSSRRAEDDIDDDEESKRLRRVQLKLRSEKREEERQLMGMTEEEMAEVEAEMESDEQPEPVQRQRIHMLVAGDEEGHVMLWDMTDSTQPIITQTSQSEPASGVSSRSPSQLPKPPFLASVSPSTVRTPEDLVGPAIGGSLLSDNGLAAVQLRSTTKRLHFNGGVFIAGVAAIVPEVIRVTMRQDDGTFTDLTPVHAVMWFYKQLKLFVALSDGSLHYFTSHPVEVGPEETVEDVEEMMRRAPSPGLVKTEREVAGCFEYPAFNVFFQKTLVDFHPNLVTFVAHDAPRSNLWVAHTDGTVMIYDVSSLFPVARLPGPMSPKMLSPPSHDYVKQLCEEYFGIAGDPVPLFGQEFVEEGVDGQVIVPVYQGYMSAMCPAATVRSNRYLLVEQGGAEGEMKALICTNLPESRIGAIDREKDKAEYLLATKERRDGRLQEKLEEQRNVRRKQHSVDVKTEKLELVRKQRNGEAKDIAHILLFTWYRYLCLRKQERRRRQDDEILERRRATKTDNSKDFAKFEEDSARQWDRLQGAVSDHLATTTGPRLLLDRFDKLRRFAHTTIEHRFSVKAANILYRFVHMRQLFQLWTDYATHRALIRRAYTNRQNALAVIRTKSILAHMRMRYLTLWRFVHFHKRWNRLKKQQMCCNWLFLRLTVGRGVLHYNFNRWVSFTRAKQRAKNLQRFGSHYVMAEDPDTRRALSKAAMAGIFSELTDADILTVEAHMDAMEDTMMAAHNVELLREYVKAHQTIVESVPGVKEAAEDVTSNEVLRDRLDELEAATDKYEAKSKEQQHEVAMAAFNADYLEREAARRRNEEGTPEALAVSQLGRFKAAFVGWSPSQLAAFAEQHAGREVLAGMTGAQRRRYGKERLLAALLALKEAVGADNIEEAEEDARIAHELEYDEWAEAAEDWHDSELERITDNKTAQMMLDRWEDEKQRVERSKERRAEEKAEREAERRAIASLKLERAKGRAAELRRALVDLAAEELQDRHAVFEDFCDSLIHVCRDECSSRAELAESAEQAKADAAADVEDDAVAAGRAQKDDEAAATLQKELDRCEEQLAAFLDATAQMEGECDAEAAAIDEEEERLAGDVLAEEERSKEVAAAQNAEDREINEARDKADALCDEAVFEATEAARRRREEIEAETADDAQKEQLIKKVDEERDHAIDGHMAECRRIQLDLDARLDRLEESIKKEANEHEQRLAEFAARRAALDGRKKSLEEKEKEVDDRHNDGVHGFEVQKRQLRRDNEAWEKAEIEKRKAEDEDREKSRAEQFDKEAAHRNKVRQRVLLALEHDIDTALVADEEETDSNVKEVLLQKEAIKAADVGDAEAAALVSPPKEEDAVMTDTDSEPEPDPDLAPQLFEVQEPQPFGTFHIANDAKAWAVSHDAKLLRKMAADDLAVFGGERPKCYGTAVRWGHAVIDFLSYRLSSGTGSQKDAAEGALFAAVFFSDFLKEEHQQQRSAFGGELRVLSDESYDLSGDSDFRGPEDDEADEGNRAEEAEEEWDGEAEYRQMCLELLDNVVPVAAVVGLCGLPPNANDDPEEAEEAETTATTTGATGATEAEVEKHDEPATPPKDELEEKAKEDVGHPIEEDGTKEEDEKVKPQEEVGHPIEEDGHPKEEDEKVKPQEDAVAAEDSPAEEGGDSPAEEGGNGKGKGKGKNKKRRGKK